MLVAAFLFLKLEHKDTFGERERERFIIGCSLVFKENKPDIVAEVFREIFFI